MKSLYESLLDDFEDMESSQDTDNVNNILLPQADEEAGVYKYKYGRPIQTDKKLSNGEDIPETSFIENGILKLGHCRFYEYTPEVHDILMKAKSIAPYDEIHHGTELAFANGMKEVTSKVAKTINVYNGGVKFGMTTKLVKDLNINVWINKVGDQAFLHPPIDNANGFKLEMVNCKITCGGNYLDNKRMRFGDIPEFKNCKITGINRINIYGPFCVRDRDDKLLSDIFDETYKAKYVDASGKEYIRKGDLKTLAATVNNPKKYLLQESELGECKFAVNPKFKLEDLIDIKCFDKDLDYIQISDNNVGIIFFKSKYETIPVNASYFVEGVTSKNTQCLPNNKEWKVTVLKRKR